MSDSIVEIDELDDAIISALTDYADDVDDVVKQTIDSIAPETRDVVKSHAPVRTGKYKKSISVRKGRNKKGEYSKEVYSKDPDYRRSHLLERPHLTRDGQKKTKATPHFKFGQDYLDENYEKQFKENLDK